MAPKITIAHGVIALKVDKSGLVASFSAVQRQLTQLGTGMGKGFNPMSTLVTKLRSGLSALGSSLFQTSLGLTALGAAGTLAFKSVMGTFMEFEQAAANAAAVSGLLGDAFVAGKAKIAEMAVELGTKTVFTAREAATAMADLARKGFEPVNLSVSELIPLLDLAAATQATLQLATETVTSTLNIFGLSFKESGDVADVFTKTVSSTAATMEFLQTSMSYIGPVAKSAGLDFKEVSAALGFLADRGIRSSTAGTALRKTISSLLNPSKDAAAVLSQLGLTQKDLDLQTNGLIGVMDNLRKSGINTGQVFKVFGLRAAPAVAAMIGLGGKAGASIRELKKLDKELNNAGGTARKVAELQLNTLGGSFTILKSNIEAVAITVGQALAPPLKDFIDNILIPLVKEIGNWAKANQDLLSGAMQDILTTITEWIGKVREWVTENGGLVGSLSLIAVKVTAFAAAVGPAALAASGFVSGLASLLGAFAALNSVSLLSSFVPMIVGGFKAIMGFLPKVTAAAQAFKPVVTAVFGKLGTIFRTLFTVGTALAGFFLSFGGIITGFVAGSAIILLVDSFGSLAAAWEWVKGVGQNVLEVFQKFPEVFGWIAEKFNQFVVGFIGAGEDFESSDVIGQFGILTDIGFRLGEIWEYLKHAWMSFVEGFRFGDEAITDAEMVNSTWVRVGQSLRGVWDTVKNAFTSYVDWLTGPWKDTAVTAFKTVGELLRLGLEQWAEWLGVVWKAIKNAFDAGIELVKTGIRNFRAFVVRVLGGPDSPIVKAFESMGQSIKNIWEKIAGWVQDSIDAIVKSVQAVPDAISSTFNSLSDFLGGGLYNLAEMTGVVPSYASGGYHAASGLAVVGEQGPELVNLPGGSRVYNAQDTASMLGGAGGGAVNININGLTVRNDDDIRKLAEEIDRKFYLMQRTERRKLGV